MGTIRVSLALLALLSCLASVEPRAFDITSNSFDGANSLATSFEVPEDKCPYSNDFGRNSFPKGFIFGTASSAYQFEGAANGGGRGLTMWDDFTHRLAERVADGSSGDVAVDFLHRYKDDIKLMKDINMDGFRFSISWTRIFPHGRRNKGINEKGIEFYNSLIDELLANGIQPAVTLYHWETPLVLEEEYGGLLDKKFVEDFKDFAKLCFERFGDRVKNWATFNEPWVTAVAGYDKGKKAPGRCSKWFDERCEVGDSSTEPYKVTHNLLLAHMEAVKEFKACKRCQENGGVIGIVLCPPWFEPHQPSSLADQRAANRVLDFVLGWHLAPLVFGDYPQTMKEIVKSRLPAFTPAEQSWFKSNPPDYVGINYYTALYASDRPWDTPDQMSYTNDQHAIWKTTRDGVPIGPKGAGDAMYSYPKGLRSVLNHLKEKYKNPAIYIMENGIDDFNNDTISIEQALIDRQRKDYHKQHLWNLEKAICQDNVNVKGYFVWSLMDNFEWQVGYTVRFGLYYVDYKNDLKRYPKESALWFREFLKNDIREYTGTVRSHSFDFLDLDKQESEPRGTIKPHYGERSISDM